MLDRTSCFQEITRLKNALFLEQEQDFTLFQRTWRSIAADPSSLDWLKKLVSNVLHPLWIEAVDEVVAITPYEGNYTVLAVDGSQIYPDRHIAVSSFFLINAGGCLLSYGDSGNALLFNKPELFITDTFLPQELQIPFTPDLVDAKREGVELATAYSYASQQKDMVVLFDGSLIFWHLENKPPVVRDLFLGTYLATLMSFFNDGILMAGYISMPKSKELVNIVRAKICRGQGQQKPCFGSLNDCSCLGSDVLVDTMLLDGILKPCERTAIFINRSKISEYYPPQLRPCFFYLHTGKEIARIEVPYWIAKDEKKVSTVARICMNQVQKGSGYPVVLAEAHEQAVIKTSDRQFFYHMLETISVRHYKPMMHSQKSIKKRGLGV